MVLVGSRVTRSVAAAVAQTRDEVAWTRWWEWRWVGSGQGQDVLWR